MNETTVSHIETRYYNTPPNEKTLEDCASHGYDHKGYGWNKQIDPRWSEEQRKAYEDAYNKDVTQ